VEDSLDIVRRLYAAFRDRDEAAMLALVHPDFEFWTLTGEELGRSEPYRGLEGMRQYLADVAATWEELRPLPSQFTRSGEWVLVTGRVYARGRGQVVDSSAGWRWRLRDGKIVYGRIYRSAEEALNDEPG
jgi:ketosteroid isomerase-like protein